MTQRQPIASESLPDIENSRFIDENRSISVAREDAAVCNAIKKDGNLNPIKEKLKESRNPRLRTVEKYLCDSCDKIIYNEKEGFVVHGNIYVADPKCSGGLIGNNFPEEGGNAKDVKKSVYCIQCFLRALCLQKAT